MLDFIVIPQLFAHTKGTVGVGLPNPYERKV